MNEYVSKVLNISLDNKYTRWYISIIESALLRADSRKDAQVILGYCEAHHILPRFACTAAQAKDKCNLAFLSAREHFICHWLLSKMMIGKLRYSALVAITQFRQINSLQRRILNGNEYDAIKRASKLWQNPEIGKKISKSKNQWSQEFKDSVGLRISESNKIAQSGRRWITDGVNVTRVKNTEILPEGWYIGRPKLPKWNDERRLKNSLRNANMSKDERSKMYASTHLRSPDSLAIWKQKYQRSMYSKKEAGWSITDSRVSYSGAKWYHDPVTCSETLVLQSNTVPSGYMPGRGTKTCFKIETNEVIRIPKNKLAPVGFIEGMPRRTWWFNTETMTAKMFLAGHEPNTPTWLPGRSQNIKK